MKRRVYIETTVVSLVACRPSIETYNAVRQQTTKRWWTRRRSLFSLYTSELVVEEAERGDKDQAARRDQILEELSLLEITPDVRSLAAALVKSRAMPQKAIVDAFHVATAAIHSMDYLLTWNCRHIANAELWPNIYRTCRLANVHAPIICTPDELMGESNA